MKRTHRIRSFTSCLVVFFLLTSIVCSSISALAVSSLRKEFFVAKTSNSLSKSATQLPEKVESENDSKHHNNYFFIHLVGEFLQFSVPTAQHASFYHAYRIRGNTTTIPRYLSKRSIQIWSHLLRLYFRAFNYLSLLYRMANAIFFYYSKFIWKQKTLLLTNMKCCTSWNTFCRLRLRWKILFITTPYTHFSI